MDNLNENVKTYLRQHIAEKIEEGTYSEDLDVLDDETGEYVNVHWELRINE